MIALLLERLRLALLRWLLPAAQGPIATGQRWVSADGKTTWTILGTVVCPHGTVKGIVADSRGGHYMPVLMLLTPREGPDGWHTEFLGARRLPDGDGREVIE